MASDPVVKPTTPLAMVSPADAKIDDNATCCLTSAMLASAPRAVARPAAGVNAGGSLRSSLQGRCGALTGIFPGPIVRSDLSRITAQPDGSRFPQDRAMFGKTWRLSE